MELFFLVKWKNVNFKNPFPEHTYITLERDFLIQDKTRQIFRYKLPIPVLWYMKHLGRHIIYHNINIADIEIRFHQNPNLTRKRCRTPEKSILHPHLKPVSIRCYDPATPWTVWINPGEFIERQRFPADTPTVAKIMDWAEHGDGR